jgi:hypothetical protein
MTSSFQIFSLLLFKLFVLRKYSTHRILEEGLRFYVCSLSSDTIVYKVSLLFVLKIFINIFITNQTGCKHIINFFSN